MTTSRSKALEATAALCGVAGAFWLAIGASPLIGWLCFLGSNLLWIGFARMNGHSGLGWQHVAFLATSLLGIFNALEKTI